MVIINVNHKKYIQNPLKSFHNDRLNREETSLLYYLQVINDFSFALMKETDLNGIVRCITQNVISKLDFEDCVIYLFDDEREHLIQTAAYGPKSPDMMEIVNPILIPLGAGIVGTVGLTGEHELINDTSLDPRYIIDDDIRLSELTVPIILDGAVLGVIDSEHSQKHFFNETHLKILTTIASLSATKIAQAKVQFKLSQYQVELEQFVQARTRSLKSALKALETSNKNYQDFAYIVSHDLREPLRTIASYISLFNKKYGSEVSEEGNVLLEIASKGTQRMDKLIQDLLEYARLDNEDAPKEEVDCKDLISLVSSNLALKIKESDTVIQYDSLPIIKGNKAQLGILFQNLLENAIKFRSDQAPFITIKAIEKENSFVFYVSDNGIGLPKDQKQLDYIFTIFHRLHLRTSEYTGTGIGLAMCQNIIEKHGGYIKAYPREAGGSTFEFSINKEN